MRGRIFSLWMPAAAFLLATLGWHMVGAGENAQPIPPPAGEAGRLDTAANRALDQRITLEGESMPLADILRAFADKGVNYVINAESIERQEQLHIRVKDMPLREVIPLVGMAAGLKCEISPSGLVALYAELPTEQRLLNPRRWQEMLERFRGMRGGPWGGMPGEPRLDNERPRQKDGPPRGERGRPPADPQGEQPPLENKAEVF